ncbi:MAG: DUF1631 family protein, partial [Rubrivivax sp.]
MATGDSLSNLASQARRLYTEELVKGLVGLVQAAIDGARTLLDKPSEHAALLRRRDLMQGLMSGAQNWHRGIVNGLRHVLLNGASASRPGDLPPPGTSGGGPLALVDDDTIELEIVTSRLALAIMDRASWEFADLRSRIAHLERRAELDPHDMLRAHVLARIVFEAWRSAGFTLEGWRELQTVLHEEFALLVEEAYHEANRWLAENKVLPEVDLRPFIRRSRGNPNPAGGSLWAPGSGGGGGYGEHGGPVSGYAAPSAYGGHSSGGFGSSAGSGGMMRGGVGEETRLMTRAAPLARSRDHAEAVLGRLNRLVGRHVPSFAQTGTGGAAAHPVSPGLA